MGLASDQDNALILDDSYDPDLHDATLKTSLSMCALASTPPVRSSAQAT